MDEIKCIGCGTIGETIDTMITRSNTEDIEMSQGTIDIFMALLKFPIAINALMNMGEEYHLNTEFMIDTCPGREVEVWKGLSMNQGIIEIITMMIISMKGTMITLNRSL